MHRESHPLLHPCTPSHQCPPSHRLSISPISDLIRRGEAMMMAAGIEGEDDDDEVLANFLESEILHDDGDEEGGDAAEAWPSKRARVEDPGFEEPSSSSSQQRAPPPAAAAAMDSGALSRIPPELFHHILKFLSSEDLIACSRVCRFMNLAASDEGLWRRLYCMRWGLASSTGKLRACAWKKLYIQRDQEDMIEFVRNTPSEFKEYYIQMQAAKRSQAPLPSQINDDRVILDRTVADQVSIWKSSRGLSDEAVTGHACSGKTCSYTQIADVYLCERTGRVHVCDETCREVILDESSGTLVCIISGHCFDRWLSPEEESDTLDADQQQVGVTDEAEPFMGSGRFARAYLLGYNCADEKELEAALRFC